MPRHLFFCSIKIKTGIYTVAISFLKGLFCVFINRTLWKTVIENKNGFVSLILKFGQ